MVSPGRRVGESRTLRQMVQIAFVIFLTSYTEV